MQTFKSRSHGAMTVALIMATSCFAVSQAQNLADRPEVHLNEPYWKSETMWGEGLLFVQENEGSRPEARLLFQPQGEIFLRSASGKTIYEAGKDFVADAKTGTISLPAGSKVPFVTRAALNPPPGSPNSMGGNIDGKNNLLWSEGHFFHDMEVEASYRHEQTLWGVYAPIFPLNVLPKTRKKLQEKAPLQIVTLGDSISEGYNASGFIGVAPAMPNYSELVRANLEKEFGSKVSLTNLAVAGKNSEWGLTQLDKVIAAKPDLMILAFGMNDSGVFTPEAYLDNIKKSIETVRLALPECEFVLVASMLPNPNWTAVKPERFPLYQDELKKLTGPSVALANMTSVWKDLSARKQYLDLSGNGLNHPNDFGHRLYAQVILSLFSQH